MDPAKRQERIDLFTQHCAARGLPLTVQRRAVLEAILDLDTHPTADQVHLCVTGRMPEINRATVYRSLETLVGMGIITKACHPGRVVRYDPRTDPHHHLICLHCNYVLDVEDRRLTELPLPKIDTGSFTVTEHRVQLRGICQKCREAEAIG
jgi:Fe2+ or Zn2+ uptake regulation protein